MNDESAILFRSKLLRDARYERQTILSVLRNCPAQYAPHWDVSGLPRMRSQLNLIPEYAAAQRVLIADDGIAARLGFTITQDQKQCYFLDPIDGLVLRYQRGMLGADHCEGLFRPRMFTDLPRFDLFLTACHGFDQGVVYTGGKRFVWAFQNLIRMGRVTDRTCRVVICNPDQHEHNPPNNLRLMRAHYAIVNGKGVRSYRPVGQHGPCGKEACM